MTTPSAPGPTAYPDVGHRPARDIAGRTALVTGAAGGIGRACVLRLAARGAKVRAVDRDGLGLDAVVGAAAGLPGSVEPRPREHGGPAP